MVKICHITSVHNVEDDRIYVRECLSLAKNPQYDVIICGPGSDKDLGTVRVIGCGERENSTKRRLFSYDKKLIKRALAQNADIYHIHDPELLLYAKQLKRRNAKVVFDSHEDYPEQIKTKEYIPSFLRNIVSIVYKTYENYICRIIDAAIFPCLVEGKDIFDNRVKHHTLLNNAPVEKEIPEKDINRKKLGEYVFCGGGLTKDRGIEQLIDGCYVAGVKLVIAGTFDDKNFEKHLKGKPSFSIVDYKGFCSRKEIMRLYKDAGLGASTLQKKGQYPKIWNLPTKVYEFMMYELPFIISDFDYCKRVINEYDCGVIVDASDPCDIARGIREIVNNPEKALQMGRNGKRAIKKEFNWSIEEKKLYELYERLMSED